MAPEMSGTDASECNRVGTLQGMGWTKVGKARKGAAPEEKLAQEVKLPLQPPAP